MLLCCIANISENLFTYKLAQKCPFWFILFGHQVYSQKESVSLSLQRIEQKTERKRHTRKKQLHLNHTLEHHHFPQHLPCVPPGCTSGWWDGIHPSLEEGRQWQCLDWEEAQLPAQVSASVWWVPQWDQHHPLKFLFFQPRSEIWIKFCIWVTILYHDQTEGTVILLNQLGLF